MASHGHFHRLHARNALPEPVAAGGPATLVSVVYVTATPTFDGPIAGYTTIGVAGAAQSSQDPAAANPSTTAAKSSAAAVKPSASSPPAAKSSAIEVDTNSVTSSAATKSSSSALPNEITAPSTSLATSASIAVATNSPSTTPNPTLALNAGSAASSSATSSASSSDGGMSTGGKAGVAIGVLLLVGAILSLVLYCFKKRKNKAKQALAEHEKYDDPFADPTRSVSIRSSPNAPRLSLRPVTEFIPNLMEKRASRGNALMTGTSVPLTEKALPVVRPDTAQSNEAANPFGSHAETIDNDNQKGPVVMTSPVVEHATAPSPVQFSTTPDVVPAAAIGTADGTPVALTAPVGLKRGASRRENAPKHLDFTKTGPFMGPPSPAGTEFSTHSDSATSPTQTNTSAAIAAAGGPATSVVHRVQLDFKPSMDDELELRAGQLIRMLHEYDDGWALCIRLDRSQQGVVPRTCLSTRPVKPRPQQNGPRVSPQGRPMSPGMHQQGRPVTPNSQGRSRAPSNPQQQRRNSPPVPTRMNPVGPMDNYGPAPLRTPSGNAPQRKPVPGQAL